MDDFKKELLSNKNVVDEINRHRWLESEKAGQDIGFETAAGDWLKRFSTSWMQYHMPEKLKQHTQQQPKKEISAQAENISAKKLTRRARSYY